ncbi:MAG TPA: hypothetical protein VMV59_04835 [Candidatus Dormibacteraeota bacterium]|nr:hypothetical protein [Candidatus Dormibacteraeota bacterium]
MTAWKGLVAVGVLAAALPCSQMLTHVPSPQWPKPFESSASKKAAPQADATSDSSSIVPGERIGPLRLGDTEQRFWELFHRYESGSDEYNYPCRGGWITELHWNEPVSAGIFAYAKSGHILQIAVASPHFRTANGITEDSTPQKVKRFYPNLEAYWLENQRDLATGDRDFIYWVDRKIGIAFEFAYAPDVHRRLVYRIFVFKPGTDFQPEGCVQYPQVWKKIAPYSLEPPTKKPQ